MPAVPNPRVAIFPGTFDPPTLGHLDLIARAARLFDRLIVAVLHNAAKQPRFSVDLRVAMLREAVASQPGVDVEAFEGLLVHYARARGVSAIVRGIRGGADLDYERQMAATNRHLDAAIDTVFLAPSPAVAHISSTLVREILSAGGPVRGLVPPAVEARLASEAPAGRTQRA